MSQRSGECQPGREKKVPKCATLPDKIIVAGLSHLQELIQLENRVLINTLVTDAGIEIVPLTRKAL
jgi:hypothetical protein